MRLAGLSDALAPPRLLALPLGGLLSLLAPLLDVELPSSPPNSRTRSQYQSAAFRVSVLIHSRILDDGGHPTTLLVTQKFRNRDFQGIRQHLESTQGYVALTSLDGPYVRPVKVAGVSKRLLRETAPYPIGANLLRQDSS